MISFSTVVEFKKNLLNTLAGTIMSECGHGGFACQNVRKERVELAKKEEKMPLHKTR